MARIDRHQLVKDLIEGGLSDKLSEILGKAFFSNNNIENLVTREQFVHLEKDQSDIKTDLAVIKQTMATKTDIAEIKTDILKWMIPFFLGIVALNITTIGIVISYLGK